jgi:hypothetical protein
VLRELAAERPEEREQLERLAKRLFGLPNELNDEE